MATIDYTVVRVPVERTLELRKAVLRPYLAEDEPYVVADDSLPTTVAFGAVTDDDRVIARRPDHARTTTVRFLTTSAAGGCGEWRRAPRLATWASGRPSSTR